MNREQYIYGSANIDNPSSKKPPKKHIVNKEIKEDRILCPLPTSYYIKSDCLDNQFSLQLLRESTNMKDQETGPVL